MTTKKTKPARKRQAPRRGGPRTGGLLQTTLDRAAERLIREILADENGVVSRTALRLGITRVALMARMSRYGISPDTYRRT
jgi:DNA-binding NtrC family response regulator